MSAKPHCVFTSHFGSPLGLPTTPRIRETSLVQKHPQVPPIPAPSSWEPAAHPRHFPCHQESGQVTCKGLSNVTGTFDLKLSFNLFHHMATGSLAFL